VRLRFINYLLEKLGLKSPFQWYQPKDPTPREQCPCCDYYSLPERGNYLVCPICFWEDEGQDLHDTDEYSGPNHMTLQEGRENFTSIGACDKEMLKHVLPIEKRVLFKYKKR